MSSRKESATSFLQMAGTGDVRAAFDKFVTPGFIHHNQYFKGDRDSLITAIEDVSKRCPNKSIDTKYIYEDGDTVITHSLVTRRNPEEQDIAVVHIFRFENDRIAELWDLGQPIAKDSPNENGMF